MKTGIKQYKIEQLNSSVLEIAIKNQTVEKPEGKIARVVKKIKPATLTASAINANSNTQIAEPIKKQNWLRAFFGRIFGF